jgi:hypothetical protein
MKAVKDYRLGRTLPTVVAFGLVSTNGISISTAEIVGQEAGTRGVMDPFPYHTARPRAATPSVI